AGCAAAQRAHAAPPVPLPPAIDTHTHFYDPTRPEGVPWPGKGGPLYRRVLPSDWLEPARPVGITETVVIEASPWVEDNQWLLDVARDHPCLIGVVGRLPIGEDGCTKLIDRFAAAPKFRGVRASGAAVVKGLDSADFMRDSGAAGVSRSRARHQRRPRLRRGRHVGCTAAGDAGDS
ncbi:MAG: amidohydrolase family protein, partial [Planctomycetia bacterium]